MGQLDMTSQSTAYANLINVPVAGTGCSGWGMRVVPNTPASSLFYLKVTSAYPCGVEMPFGGMGLSQARADMIKSWIAMGALNN